MARVGSGTTTLNALLKPGKDAAKVTKNMMKAQMSIVKSAVKNFTAKRSKPKISMLKPVKLPKSIATPMLGKHISTTISKAKFGMKRKA